MIGEPEKFFEKTSKKKKKKGGGPNVCPPSRQKVAAELSKRKRSPCNPPKPSLIKSREKWLTAHCTERKG